MDLFTYALAKGGQGSGGTGVTVDSVLSDTSENPVQNKVLKAALDAKAASASVPTKVSDLTNDSGFITNAALSGYATEAELEGYVTGSALETALSAKADTSAVNAALALKANSADVTAAIAAAIGSVSSFEYYLCGNGEYDPQTGVPTVQNPDAEHIYLVPTSGSNLNMYAYISGGFTFLGTTEVDLSGYAKTADLADVATSGSYEDLDDTPDIPEKTSELTNDAGFITKPRTTYLSQTPSDEEDGGSGFVGGADHAYSTSMQPTADIITAMEAIAELTDTVYINRDDLPATVEVDENGGIQIYTNVKPTETGAAMGVDVADLTKPAYLIWLMKENGTYITLVLMGTEHIKDREMKVFSQGDYLTEHQSLAGYAKTADLADYATTAAMNTALAAKQNTLTFDNSPTANSSNPVKSGGVYTALAGKQATLTFDSTPQSSSENPVKSKGIYYALAAKANTADLATVATSGSYNDLSNKPTIPTIPEKLVTGSAKAYTIVVANSAPSSGTADSVITIVV